MTGSRRHVLGLFTGGVCLAWGGMAAAAAACFDLQSLPDLPLRQSLNFKVVSKDPKRTCAACAFFTAGQPASCGACAIFSNGPTTSGSVCDSWSDKS